MLKIIQILLCGIVTSCYYFPIILKKHLWFNSKTVMAAVGLVFILYNISKNKDIIDTSVYVKLIIYSTIVTFIAYISITLNNTPDFSYAYYVISMSVWLCAAFFVVFCIESTHKYLSFSLISNYIIGVCVFQCIITLCIEYIPEVKNWVDSIFEMDQNFLEYTNRLYGIGAFLDTAGIRYSIALILCAALLADSSKSDNKLLTLIYTIAFLLISFIGNIVARTTLVGLGLGTFYIIYKGNLVNKYINSHNSRIWNSLFLILIISLPLVIYYYNTNSTFKSQVEFGFEGFFNLFEEGEWKVGSNIQLQRMIVWPESIKTWIIGDGYFNNPDNIDPYYVGKHTGGYYMGTDIGYLRFIFYFGILGLLAFSVFIIKAGTLCIQKWDNRKFVFTLIIIANFIIWFKVSTDIFLVFALFLALPPNIPKLDKPISLL